MHIFFHFSNPMDLWMWTNNIKCLLNRNCWQGVGGLDGVGGSRSSWSCGHWMDVVSVELMDLFSINMTVLWQLMPWCQVAPGHLLSQFLFLLTWTCICLLTHWGLSLSVHVLKYFSLRQWLLDVLIFHHTANKCCTVHCICSLHV